MLNILSATLNNGKEIFLCCDTDALLEYQAAYLKVHYTAEYEIGESCIKAIENYMNIEVLTQEKILCLQYAGMTSFVVSWLHIRNIMSKMRRMNY